jgi:hypothetical protein
MAQAVMTSVAKFGLESEKILQTISARCFASYRQETGNSICFDIRPDRHEDREAVRQ